jgi:hypothetical protein
VRPDTHTVQELFERDVRYLVPLYQRPYVWDEEHQWEPLWDDISALLQHQEIEGGDHWSHFLGAIVLEQEQTAPGEIPRFTVIDGQQRLTTLQILLAATATALAAAGAEDDAALLRELTNNNPRKAKGDDCLKVWPTNVNRSAFVAVMAPEGPPPDREDDPANLIDEAFAYFEKKCAAYLAEGGDARSERLRVTLCDLLKVVSIALDRDDNAQVIFETLNARGTPLLALDLVKNAVFARANREDDDSDLLYEEVWRPQLDQDYWREERRQGRLNRPRGELFLVHWLVMRLAKAVPATELFPTFRQRILTEGVEAEPLVRELCRDAAVLRSFDTPEPHTPEAEFFARLEVLDAGTVLPVVLLLFRSPEVSEAVRRRALRILESWLSRRALMRLTTRNYNQLVPQLVGRMQNDLESADGVLLAELAGRGGEISRWPGDEEFREFVETQSVYGSVSQERLVMALATVEAHQYTNKTDLVEIPGKLSIEHLMPREWAPNWPLPDVTFGSFWETAKQQDVAEEQREERINRLGNLTIVTSPLNSSLSNGPWRAKRAALNHHSRLLLNGRLSELNTWDEEAIDERGAWLADQLIEVWPGPTDF